MASSFWDRRSQRSVRQRGFLSRSTDAPQQPGRSEEIRAFRLGVDYGTSMSKLVATDYGSAEGPHSYVVRLPPGHERENECRLPSTVTVIGKSIHFGFAAESRSEHAADVYRSLKMRCAYPDHFYGDHTDLPSGLTASDLATLYVAYLIQVGQQAVTRYAKRLRAQPSLGITLGVPMAQIDHTGLKEKFVNIAREAFELRGMIELLDGATIADATDALLAVREELAGSFPKEPRDWVRSEAEAALFWAHSSPDIDDGRYACVDIGAGTTSASWFHITARRMGDVLVKDGFSFYGAACAPPGCDAIGVKLATHLNVSTNAEIRGHEAEFLERLSEPGTRAVEEVLEEMGTVFAHASKAAFSAHKSAAAWKHIGRIFFLGGGSKIGAVRDKLIEQKAGWLKADPIAQPGVPVDLTEEDGDESREDPTFMLVAYGLARRLADVPDTFSPSQVGQYEPRSETRDQLSHEDLYSD